MLFFMLKMILISENARSTSEYLGLWANLKKKWQELPPRKKIGFAVGMIASIGLVLTVGILAKSGILQDEYFQIKESAAGRFEELIHSKSPSWVIPVAAVSIFTIALGIKKFYFHFRALNYAAQNPVIFCENDEEFLEASLSEI